MGSKEGKCELAFIQLVHAWRFPRLFVLTNDAITLGTIDLVSDSTVHFGNAMS